MNTKDRNAQPQRILIRTKLNRPEPPARQVVRPRLLERLDAAADRRLTLISAPAGYGKTTLAAQWLERRGGDVAWISLDRDDSDPERLARYLVAAFRGIDPSCLARTAALLDAVSDPPWSYFVDVLISELADLEWPVVLAADDYHSIASAEVDELFCRLVEHLPTGMHLLVLSRTDPAWPLARWRAKGWLADLRQRDLRFSHEEVRSFFAEASRDVVSDDDLETLSRKTEGWIAGLQLARVSIDQAPDPRERVQRFSGSDRLIADYLIEEVLAAQPPEVRELLEATAHLERFCAPLCQHLLADGSARPAAAELLARIERDNLFLVPLDAEHHWFRYHHLFAELLTHHLTGATSRDRRQQWLRRAAEWFAEERLVEEALRYWVEVGDLDVAAAYLGRNLEALLNLDVSRRLLARVLSIFPTGSEEGRLPLLMAHVWVRYLRWDLPGVTSLLGQMDKCLARDSASNGGKTGDLGPHLDAIRSADSYWRGDAASAILHAECALESLRGDGSRPARVLARLYQALGLTTSGRLAEARAHLEAEIIEVTSRGSQHLDAYLAFVGILSLFPNDLDAVESAAQRLVEAAKSVSVSRYWLNYSYYLLGVVALERDQLAEASEQFLRVVEQRYIALSRLYHDALIGLALVAERRSDSAAAAYWAERSRSWALEIGDPVSVRIADSFDSRRSVGTPATVAETAPPSPEADAMSWFLEVPSITHAENLLRHPDGEVRRLALPAIERALASSKDRHNSRQALRLTALLADALAESGERDTALEILEEAVHDAEPQGVLRPFLGGGRSRLGLLEDLAHRRGRHGFLDRVLRAVELETRPAGPTRAETAAAPGLGMDDPLTLREHEVLELLAERFTNKEMAVRLNVSSEAVKKRLSRLYEKLDVHGRREAVAAAVARGILDQHSAP